MTQWVSEGLNSVPMICHRFHSIAQDYTLREMMALEGIGNFGRWETLFDGYSIRVFIKNKVGGTRRAATTGLRQ